MTPCLCWLLFFGENPHPAASFYGYLALGGVDSIAMPSRVSLATRLGCARESDGSFVVILSMIHRAYWWRSRITIGYSAAFQTPQDSRIQGLLTSLEPTYSIPSIKGVFLFVLEHHGTHYLLLSVRFTNGAKILSPG